MARYVKGTPRAQAYQVDNIVDAPEHYSYARAMGLLTWGTWDAEVRPYEERLRDFVGAYPPGDPMCFLGSMLARAPEGEYGPASPRSRMERFDSGKGSFGSLPEILARYGLKLRGGAAYTPRPVDVANFREVARLRNARLRRLHGGVDVEAENMDEAKAVELERLEKKQAAEEIRRATDKMRRELEGET